MKVTFVTEAQAAARQRRIVAETPEGKKETALVGVAAAAPAQAPAQAPGRQGTVGEIIAAGGKAKAADEAVGYLIQRANGATPDQVAALLQQYRLVASPELARSEGERIIELIQSKGANCIMLGVRAGVLVFVFVDSVAPAWPLRRKLIVALLAAAAVAAALFFAVGNEAPKPAPPAPTSG